MKWRIPLTIGMVVVLIAGAAYWIYFLSMGPAEEAHITVYMSPEPLADALESAFEEEHGDILEMVSGPWCRRLRVEMEAGDINADVIYGAEPLLYMMLEEKGQLLWYNSPEEAWMKSEYIMVEKYFTLANGRYAVIAYNKEKVSEPPSSWKELTEPEWNRKIAIPNAATCATAFAITCGLVNQSDLGWEFYRELKENDAILVDTAMMVVEKVTSGEVWVGICPLDAALRTINKAKKEGVESPLKIIWLEEGAIKIPRPIAIIQDEKRSEKSTELAKKFFDFVLSEEGQKIATKYGYIPVREGLPLPGGVPEKITSISIPWVWAHENGKEIRDTYESIMG